MTSIISRLSPELQQTLAELGFAQLTPIQEQSIPVLLDGRDVIGQSKTGSGKTAAFSLPILAALTLRPRLVQALVLCPTRELCAQVAREMRKFGKRQTGMQVLVVAGGQPFRPQALALEGGVHIVVGTPGRVLDHIKRGTLQLAAIKSLVLDEADRMLDMGFEDDMREILDACPRTRQTALFSATFPAAIEAMSRSYQRQPVRVTIAGGEDEGRVVSPDIRQLVVESMHEEKLNTLLWILREQKPSSSIVFCNFKASAAELATALEASGISAAAIHGDLEQRDRDRVLAKFRNRSTRILIATDVAARGLDVEAVDLVVNFDLPVKPDSYVHRIGRTGRAGRAGVAIAIATPREGHKISTIETYTSTTLQRLKRPSATRQSDAPVAPQAQLAEMTTLRLNAGRKNKLRPGDILGALTGEAGGLPGSAVGKIEIHDFFSYVAVSRDVAEAAHANLLAGRIKGRKIGVDLVM